MDQQKKFSREGMRKYVDQIHAHVHTHIYTHTPTHTQLFFSSYCFVQFVT